ncbi:hypothetical protein BKA04_000046 [Cryobacterium mesophilum]|uniref:HNH endonuclease signature motif containing protein n=1 Tax=Terrimesophilobacter mesophilus TaxID=433647 RepID=UPI000CE2E624|nr:HNH endonuclease signature motif containing protein [Terrimesophilobacter mesophilus]MBB5631823.1 hypothetical protein [Terrimesophilobacter mesophilus]
MSIPIDPQAADVDLVFELMVAELSGINPFRESLDRLGAIERARSALFAEEALELMGMVRMAVAEAGPRADVDLVVRSVTAEIAVARHLSDRTMQSRVSEAWRLVEDFPFTLHALEGGRVSVAHARVLMAEGMTIQDPQRRVDYESAVLERVDSVTPGRLRRLARAAASSIAEVSCEDRHAKAMEDRSVSCTERDNGMSEIVAVIPTILAAGIVDRLTQLGKAVKAARIADPHTPDTSPVDARTLDQLRADLFCDLLLTAEPSGHPHAAVDAIRAEVAILIPALTLLGESDEPATILGRGPIGLDDALRMAANAPSLVRVITDPVTDMVLATDNYRTTKKLRRYLRRRDGRCRCPSCNRSAWRSDIDHTIPFSDGGPTEPGNLACLCPGHHTIKHLPGWSLRQLEPGVLEWTTPHGIVAVDRPDTPVRFTA